MGPAKRIAAHKNFSARRPNKNRDKTAKGQDTAKETRKGQRDKSKNERAKERAKSPKRVASKDQQGEVPGPSFEGVCLSAGKVPNQD